MRKMNVLQFYAAAVCFFSAIVVTITGGGGVYDLVQLAAPSIGVPGSSYEAHQNNAAFAHWYVRRHRDNRDYLPPSVREEMRERGIDVEDFAPAGGDLKLPEDEAELTQLRQQSFASLLAANQHNAVRDFVREIIVLLIAGPLFWVHWRLLKKWHRE